MKKEETDLLKRCGTENPFTVPEGYFERFTEQLMEKLPEREAQPAPKLTLWTRVKPWVYMAAMFCGLMLSVRMFVGEKQSQSPAATSEMTDFTEVPDEYIDPIVNQTMMDDYTLYQYLTDADTEIYK
ncbi:MAG TPA: hypothetical protein OIM59_04880 [Bacteroides mediterraneensis]|uniref:hypothetical protein n=1 Tax=Bacteroides mediterraneensis TaxID=1841856 RepID=UPI0026279C21|nr:hypothetical protein [Bacteroides mediterraneensis]HJH63962.1 hypothetical protein [Bacteroides mediterraneensis]